MPTKGITESVIATVSKGPLVIFILFGLGLWQASNMTAQQIDTIEHLIVVLNNPVGFAIYFALLLLLVYALILFPTGRFIATMSREFVASQKAHNNQTGEHIEASKGMFRQITTLTDVCNHIRGQIDTFFDGKN